MRRDLIPFEWLCRVRHKRALSQQGGRSTKCSVLFAVVYALCGVWLSVASAWLQAGDVSGTTIPVNESGEQLLAGMTTTRPRTLVSAASIAVMRARVTREPELKAMLGVLRERSQKMEKKALPQYRPDPAGRINGAAREVIRCVVLESVLWQMTGDRVHVDRAARVVDAACAFPDWSPVHFLGTADLSMATAIAYDWMLEALTPQQRERWVTALRNKGFTPFLAAKESDFWNHSPGNWNQVCHSSMLVAALALAKPGDQQSQRVAERCARFIANGLKAYAPDGVYAEGLDYWKFGTEHTVLADASLLVALGRDWGLTKAQGFVASFDACAAITGPSGAQFDYADGSNGDMQLWPLSLWIAQHRQRPDLAAGLWRDELTTREYAPLALLWMPEQMKPMLQTAKSWIGRGTLELAAMRSGPATTATWVAIKAGAVKHNHNHLDSGQIVVEADGKRWILDGGKENAVYRTKELSMDRFSLVKVGQDGHSIPTFVGATMAMKGVAPLFGPCTLGPDTDGMRIDLSGVWPTSAERVVRGVVRSGTQILIIDEVTNARAPLRIRFLVPVQPQISGAMAVLKSSEGLQFTLALESAPQGVAWTVGALKPRYPLVEKPETFNDLHTLDLVIERAQPTLRVVVRGWPGTTIPAMPVVPPLETWAVDR